MHIRNRVRVPLPPVVSLGAVVVVVLILGLLASGCGYVSPQTREQVAFLATPEAERAFLLSSEVDSTVESLLRARAIIRTHWTEFGDEERFNLEVIEIQAVELVTQARAIADTGGIGRTMDLGRVLTRGRRIHQGLTRILLKHQEVYTPAEVAILRDADADARSFYALARVAHTASGRVDTAKAVASVAKTIIGLAL